MSGRRGRPNLIRALTMAAVVLASVLGGLLALTLFDQDKQLSINNIQLSIEPFHNNTLNLYIPLIN